ncbi:MAG: hypothetical protein ACTSWL_08240 [Promethearchaeota archaeon]
MRDDPEVYERITKNIAQASLMHDQRKKEQEIKKQQFLKQIEELFHFVNSVNNFLDSEKKDTQFIDPGSITASIELVADATPFKKMKMSFYRRLLIWRLNSYTKNRQLINDLIFKYVECFWDCYDEHYAKQLETEQLLEYAMMGMQSQASMAYSDFIQNKLAPVIYAKKREQERMINSGSKNGSVM